MYKHIYNIYRYNIIIMMMVICGCLVSFYIWYVPYNNEIDFCFYLCYSSRIHCIYYIYICNEYRNNILQQNIIYIKYKINIYVYIEMLKQCN